MSKIEMDGLKWDAKCHVSHLSVSECECLISRELGNRKTVLQANKNILKMCLCEMRRSVLSAVFPHVGPVRRVGVRERKRVLCVERFTRIVVDERVNFWPNCPLSPITRGSTAWLGFGWNTMKNRGWNGVLWNLFCAIERILVQLI